MNRLKEILSVVTIFYCSVVTANSYGKCAPDGTCVEYVREKTSVQDRSWAPVTTAPDLHACTMWDNAGDTLRTSSSPERGSIIVFGCSESLSYGHVGIVQEVTDEDKDGIFEEIVIEHSNFYWIENGIEDQECTERRVHVKAVGEKDSIWSKVKVEYTTGQYDTKKYDILGFIFNCSFQDVSDENKELAAAVTYLCKNNIVSGYPDTDQAGIHNFSPDTTINRAEFLKIILSATLPKDYLDKLKCDLENFPDIKSEEWYCKYTTEGKKRGLVEGYANEGGIFKPSESISRAEAVKIIHNAYFGESLEEVKSVPWEEKYFNQEDMRECTSSIFTDGQNRQAKLTRKEMARLIYCIEMRVKQK